MNETARTSPQQNAFTRIELAIVTATVGLMALVVLPAVAQSASLAGGLTCVGNLGRMSRAWQLYADENQGKLVNNFGIAEMQGSVSSKTYLNWTHNVMDWSTNPSNTNTTLAAASKLFPFLEGGVGSLKCPADNFLSSPQKSAGWTRRLRSYSMNGFMGPFSANKSDSSHGGQNFLSPAHRQFIVQNSIPSPSTAMVFLDEHPDSINDGIFLATPSNPQWLDLPGSHHNGAGGVSFADGSADIHSWANASTKVPVRAGFGTWGPIPSNQRQDFQWLTQRMTVPHHTLGITKTGSQIQASWSPHSSTYVLQHTASLTQPDWQNVQTSPAKASGLVTVETPADAPQKHYRLKRP